MKPRIAVVEDNPDNRMLVEAILDELYDIVEFETGHSDEFPVLVGHHGITKRGCGSDRRESAFL